MNRQQEVVDKAMGSLEFEAELGQKQFYAIKTYMEQVYSIGFYHGRKANLRKGKKIKACDKDGRVLSFESIEQAAQAVGSNRSDIFKVLSPKYKHYKTCKGYKFWYAEDD